MRKVIFIFVGGLILFNLDSYSFWIWSPKTKEWKNPVYAPYPDPKLQLKEALKVFEQGNYKRALGEFKKLISYYPDAKEAAEAQFYIALCYEKLNNPYRAFLEYKKVVVTYPNSKRIYEAVKRQYKIGESFIGWEEKKVLGMPVYIWKEHPAVVIFGSIAEVAPYSEYAPKALYQLGMLFVKLKRYEEAKSSFQRIIEEYPQTEVLDKAKYQLAAIAAKTYSKINYDATTIEKDKMTLKDLSKSEKEIAPKAKKALKELEEKEAKSYFDTAQFYEKQAKYKSAIIYYRHLINKYPQSELAEKAKQRIEKLKERIN